MSWSRQDHPGLALLYPQYRRHARAFVLGFVLLALTSLTSAAIPYAMKLATDALVQDGETRLFAGVLVVLALVNALLRIRSRTHVYRIGREVEHTLREAYHNHLQAMDAGYYDQARTGDLVSRGTTDILAIRMFIGPGFLQLSNTLMAYGVTLPVMIGLDPWLTLVAISPYPVVLVLARLLTRRLYVMSRAVADRFGELVNLVQESLAGMAVIRNHGQEENWQARFQQGLATVYRTHADHTNLQSVFSPLMLFSGAASGVLILAYGGQKVAERILTIGDFVAFAGYMALLIWPTVGFGWILTVLQRGLAALDRMHQVMAIPPRVAITGPDPGVTRWQGHVRVQGLDFTYPGRDEQRLANIQLQIAAGSFVGLVGRVGCGKSTLLQALAGLYPVPANTVFYDGRDLATLSESEVRANLAMAPQESFLFSTTVQENLLYGLAVADEASAWHWAEQVAMAEEIRQFPRQMQTLVGERGITLSGGQRQRVALARALSMQPAVLLLDDIFASVDARTEAAILDRLFQQHGPTVIMVCHRIAALHRADVIYVMEEGRVVDHGNHEQLLATSPLYRELHQRMARSEALEALQ